MNNQGVGAEGLLAAQSVLAADGDEFGNDGRVEHLWVLKAIGKLLFMSKTPYYNHHSQSTQRCTSTSFVPLTPRC